MSLPKKFLIVAGTLAGLVYLVGGLRNELPVPEYISLGPFNIRLYSIMIILAAALVVLVVRRLLRDEAQFKDLDWWEALLAILIPGIIGARIYHVLTDYYLYVASPGLIIAVWYGGLGIIGGIIGGLVGAVLYAKFRKLPVGTLVGALTVGMPLAQAVGRLGNFFNRELFGLPTDLPWGVYIAPEYLENLQLRAGLNLAGFEYFHPLFLYEAVANVLLFALLLSLWRRYSGSGIRNFRVFTTYIVGYSVIRFFLDFLRIEGASGVGYLSYAQWLILAMYLLVLVFGLLYQLWYWKRNGKWFTQH
jgi:phosphatidylglycerol:prolipoprotein diacylglycerol transferase